jgi:hypothetical protein
VEERERERERERWKEKEEGRSREVQQLALKLVKANHQGSTCGDHRGRLSLVVPCKVKVEIDDHGQ